MPWARSFWAFSPTSAAIIWTYDTPSYDDSLSFCNFLDFLFIEDFDLSDIRFYQTF